MRESVGKRRPIVKHKFIGRIAGCGVLLNRGSKGVVLLPKLQRFGFDCRKIRLWINLWIRHGA
jgi:hypothetical protein